MSMNNECLAPVILMTYARPEHTQKTLDALANNQLASESELFIFCDGPKNEKTKEKNQEVRNIIQTETERKRFKNVTVTISEKNKGLANSIISGVTEIMEIYGKCILIEDDLVTAAGFLTFMNECLDFYEKDKKIWSISGFTYPLTKLDKYPYDVYLSYRACSHGWATWKDRWDTVDWEVKDYPELEKSFSKRRRFNRGGNDLFRMLRHQIRGERDSWAIRFCYAQSKQDRLTIYPKYSLVKNIGFDGSGTHCSDNQTMQKLTINQTTAGLKPETVEINGKLIREFKEQYRVKLPEAAAWGVNKVLNIIRRKK